MLSVIPAAESKCVCAGKFVWCVCVHESGCASLCVWVCVCEWVAEQLPISQQEKLYFEIVPYRSSNVPKIEAE